MLNKTELHIFLSGSAIMPKNEISTVKFYGGKNKNWEYFKENGSETRV